MIKMIGDQVMHVADDATVGCEIGLRLVEAFHADEILPPVRGGLASGEAITQEGDYFGPTVNLAARATKLAQPDDVLVPESLTREVAETTGYTFRRVGPRLLKGFADAVTLYALRRAR